MRLLRLKNDILIMYIIYIHNRSCIFSPGALKNQKLGISATLIESAKAVASYKHLLSTQLYSLALVIICQTLLAIFIELESE